jgi:hypothetical protein
MDDTDNATITLPTLLAWLREYVRLRSEGATQIQIDTGYGGKIYDQILQRAIEGLELLEREQAREPPSPRGGRKLGSGMGDLMAELVDNGMSVPGALAVTKGAFGKPDTAVMLAYARVLERRAAKNPPADAGVSQKTPPQRLRVRRSGI